MFLVIAGTDTGVGKTFVTTALARALARGGLTVAAVKPIETGCGEAVASEEDGALLAAATNQASPRAALIRLRQGVTPALAADTEGRTLDFDAIAHEVRRVATGRALVLVEGAGGLLSPMTWSQDVGDLARLLGAPVLLVGSDRLGVLHHVRAAKLALDAKGLVLAAVVLSAPVTADASTGANLESLERVGFAKDVLVALPRCSADEAVELLAPLARSLTAQARSARPA